MSRPRVWGHRGSPRRAPENTLASLERAIRDGAHGVEFDVQSSADGVPVVLHDDTLDRTTDGRGPVRSLTTAALRSLDAGSWFGPGFRGERLPRLDEVLALVGERAVEAVLEIKDGRPEAIAAAVDSVRRHRLFDRVYFHSFAAADLRIVRSLAPHARLQLIGDVVPQLLDVAIGLGAAACSPYDEHLRAEQILPSWVEKARAAGLELNAGLVNDPALWEELGHRGIGAVFTDVPDVLAAAAPR